MNHQLKRIIKNPIRAMFLLSFVSLLMVVALEISHQGHLLLLQTTAPGILFIFPFDNRIICFVVHETHELQRIIDLFSLMTNKELFVDEDHCL